MPVPAAAEPPPSDVLISTVAASTPDVLPEPPIPRVAMTAVAAALATKTKMTMKTPNMTTREVRLGGGGGSYV
jgi:hypothetical protein